MIAYIAEDVIMSNRKKGVCGLNPTNQPQFQKAPRHVSRPEASDAGAMGSCLIACVITLGLMLFSFGHCGAQTNFSASRSWLTDKETGIVERADVGLFIEFSRDTVTVRGLGIVFRETGVQWVQADDGHCQAMGPGYVFSWWPGRLDISNKLIYWILKK